jgi:hypothetical protein
MALWQHGSSIIIHTNIYIYIFSSINMCVCVSAAVVMDDSGGKREEEARTPSVSLPLPASPDWGDTISEIISEIPG